MPSKQPTQADRQGEDAADPIASAPGKQGDKSESDGGPYVNPHSGKDDPQGFAGGQSDRAYSGGPNPNATTKD